MSILPQGHLLDPSGQHSSKAKAWIGGSCNPSDPCKSLARTSFPPTSWSTLSLDLKPEIYVPQKVSEDLKFSYPCASACLTLGHLLKPLLFSVCFSCTDDKSLLLSPCRRQQASKQETLYFNSDLPPVVQMCQEEYIQCV